MPFWIEVLGWLTKLVMVFLLGLSVWSVQIMIERRRFLKSLVMESPEQIRDWIAQKNWDQLKKWAAALQTPQAQTMKACLELGNPSPEQVDRAVEAYLSSTRPSLEKGLLVLGSLGSNAPFIGLFGTVLGIIQSFGALGQNQGQNMNLVMSGISEALVSTAIGLLVAIPAVVAFNYFSTQVKLIMNQCHSLKNLYLASRGDAGR